MNVFMPDYVINLLVIELCDLWWLEPAFYCAPRADPASLASPPWVAGLRHKVPACRAENIQILFCSRQRMSGGVGAVRLKMGLSFRTRSLNPQKHSLGGCEPLGMSALHPSAHIVPFPPSLSPSPPASFHLQVGLLQPTACMY